jgi:transposase
MSVSTLGIDLGKTSFHAVGLDAKGEPVLRRRFSRPQLLHYSAMMAPCVVGLEACCGAHYLGRALRAQGHDVRLMPPQYVRPFVKTHKNDYIDAEAIAEAVQRPTMRFVPIKTDDQLDLQALHRVRNRLVARRTSVINQMRAFCSSAASSAARGGTICNGCYLNSSRKLRPRNQRAWDDCCAPCAKNGARSIKGWRR